MKRKYYAIPAGVPAHPKAMLKVDLKGLHEYQKKGTISMKNFKGYF